MLQETRRRRRQGDLGRERPPQKKSGKIFLGNYVKFGHFGANIMQISRILSIFGHISQKFGNLHNISGKYHVQFGHFVDLSQLSDKNVRQSRLSSYV